MATKRQRNSFTLRMKMEVIREVDAGVLPTDIAKRLELNRSTIATIIKNRKKIEDSYKNNKFTADRKRLKLCAFPELEKALILWLKQARSLNINVSGLLLKEKAQELSSKLKLKNFNFSSGWFNNFRRRHEISFSTMSRKNNAGNSDVVTCCQENEVHNILQEYEPQDIFNIDETRILWNLVPEQTMILKNNFPKSYKQNKDRITVLVGANMNGTEKLELLVIGNSAKPRSFKNVTLLPVDYEANSEAWITQSIFEKWLYKLDAKFLQENRKVVILLDNCPAHGKVENLQAIRLKFVPPNTAAMFQPMNRGIIQNLKLQYRKKILESMLFSLRAGKKQYQLNFLNCVHDLALAWYQVPQQVICQSFYLAGFPKCLVEIKEENMEDYLVACVNELLIQLRDHGIDIPEEVNAQVYSNTDASLEICKELSMDDIAESVKHQGKVIELDYIEGEEDISRERIPSFLEIIQMIDSCKLYCSVHGLIDLYEKTQELQHLFFRSRPNVCNKQSRSDVLPCN